MVHTHSKEAIYFQSRRKTKRVPVIYLHEVKDYVFLPQF